jgi:serine/threonine protein kinase
VSVIGIMPDGAPRKTTAVSNGGGKRQVSFRDDEGSSFKVPLKDDGGAMSSSDRATSSAGQASNVISMSDRSNASIESIQSGSSKESIATALSRDSIGGVSLPSLQQTLMRTKKNRDPLKYYEIIKVLGDGSMGSVSKVKKRASAVGGSARKDFVEEEHRDKIKREFFPCFTIFCFPGNRSNGRAGSNNSFVDVTSTRTDSNGGSSAISGITVDSKGTRSTDDSDERSPVKQKRPSKSKEDRIKSFKKNPGCSSTMIEYGKETTVVYALKSIILERVTDSVFKKELLNEIAILRSLDHPNIVKAVETYDYKNRMYLVLELCSGGDLYARDPYDENQAKAIVASILDAIAYLHSKNITHRDLKYENIMFASPTTNTVKIIDFGLSKKYGKSTEVMHETVGTGKS